MCSTSITLPVSAQTLAHVRQTKTLTCAIDQAPPEESLDDLHGPRIAFDLELCHVVALAAGPDIRVQPVLITDELTAMEALKTGRADLVPTLSLDRTHTVDAGITMGPPILLDGTALLAPNAITTAAQLSGRKVCFLAETETETALRTWFRLHGLDLLPYPFSEEGEMQAAFTSGNCAAIAADRTRLAAVLEAIGPPAIRFHVLPETLAADPLAPATRAADPAWSRIVLWAYELLLNAQRQDVGQTNLKQWMHSADAGMERLLGQTHELGSSLGLDDTWPTRVLSTVGNYGELLKRTLPAVQVATPDAISLK